MPPRLRGFLPSPIPHVLAAIAPVFTAIETIFPPVPPILEAIQAAAVLPRVANIFTSVAPVLAVIPPVFPPIHAILEAVPSRVPV